MKKTVLFFFLLTTVCACVFCQEVNGNSSVQLSLIRENVELFDFGLSSKPVDTANAPVPVDSVFELTDVVQDYADTASPSLVASGSVYVYWDIATRDGISISISIPVTENADSGAMIGRENKGKLEWCCYFEQDGVFYYMGHAGIPVDIPQNATIEKYDYGKTLTVYEDGNPLTVYEDGKSYPYTRTASQLVTFQTDNAYPTSDLPADEYEGNFRITVDILG